MRTGISLGPVGSRAYLLLHLCWVDGGAADPRPGNVAVPFASLRMRPCAHWQ